MTIDGNTWSGIALVISALLLPVVTRYSSGGVAAKAEAADAEDRAEKAEAEVKRERASGQRWFRLFVEWHGHARHERAGRLMDREVLKAIPGAPVIDWPALEPLTPMQQVMDHSTANLSATE